MARKSRPLVFVGASGLLSPGLLPKAKRQYFVQFSDTVWCPQQARIVPRATLNSPGLVTLDEIQPGPPGPEGPVGPAGPAGPGMTMPLVSDVLALAPAQSDASGNFIQIGDGVTTGFPNYTAAFASGTYLCRYTFDCSGLADGGDATGQFRLNFDGAIPSQAIAHRTCNQFPARQVVSAFVNLGSLSAGNHTAFIEWNDGDLVNVLYVDAQSALRLEFFKIA